MRIECPITSSHQKQPTPNTMVYILYPPLRVDRNGVVPVEDVCLDVEGSIVQTVYGCPNECSTPRIEVPLSNYL